MESETFKGQTVLSEMTTTFIALKLSPKQLFAGVMMMSPSSSLCWHISGLLSCFWPQLFLLCAAFGSRLDFTFPNAQNAWPLEIGLYCWDASNWKKTGERQKAIDMSWGSKCACAFFFFLSHMYSVKCGSCTVALCPDFDLSLPERFQTNRR